MKDSIYISLLFCLFTFIISGKCQEDKTNKTDQWNHELNIGYPVYSFAYNKNAINKGIITGYFISYNPLYRINEKIYIEGQIGYEFLVKNTVTDPDFFKSGDVKFIVVQAGVRWYLKAEPSNFRPYVKLLPAYVYREDRRFSPTFETDIDGISYVWLSGGLFFDIKNRYNFGVSVNASISISIRAGFKL